MKLDNKGVTLVEIIISVALISIVLIFLFTLLIQVNNENSDNEIKSSYLINQSTFIKQIEEDFLDNNFSGTANTCKGYVSISSTEESNDLYLPRLYGGNAIFDGNGETRNIKCLQFTYPDNSQSYLFIYKRIETNPQEGEPDYKTILSYYRGEFKQSVELEEFDWTINTQEVSIKSDTNYYTFSLPIIGPDYNDYSINLSYAN